MSCTQEQIEKHCDSGKLAMEKVLTPEWGKPGFVFIRGLMASESDLITTLSGDENVDDAVRRRTSMAAWTVACACKEDGSRIFDDEFIKWLSGKTSPLAPLYRCAMKAMDVNGLTEDLVGNVTAIQSGSSP